MSTIDRAGATRLQVVNSPKPKLRQCTVGALMPYSFVLKFRRARQHHCRALLDILYSTTPTPRFGVACRMISGLDQVGGTPTIFTCDTVTREIDCRITSRVINIYRHPCQAMECFLSNTLLRNCEVSNTVKTPSSRHSCLRGISWSRYCDVTLIHCGVILTECPQNVSILSTQKNVPRVFPPSPSWLSLVNYRVRFTALSPLIV